MTYGEWKNSQQTKPISESELATQEIEYTINKFLQTYPSYSKSFDELKSIILSKGKLEDIETKFVKHNIYVRLWITHNNKTVWEQITDIPYEVRTDIPFQSFPNYTYDMYNGVTPARIEEHYFVANTKPKKKKTEVYQGRYGSIEIMQKTKEFLTGSIGYLGADYFILGDRLWITKIPHGAEGKVKHWCSPNAEPIVMSRRQETMCDDSALRLINKLNENIPQLQIFKAQALKIYDEQVGR